MNQLHDEGVQIPPKTRLKSPTFRIPIEHSPSSSHGQDGYHSSPRKRRRYSKHVSIDEPDRGVKSDRTNIYLGSYRNSPQRSAASLGGSSNVSQSTPTGPSPRASISHLQLESLLTAVDVELETYGVDELRDGFFDASFYRPIERDRANMSRRASDTLPQSLARIDLPLAQALIGQTLASLRHIRTIVMSRSGIRLAKSFLGFFIAYILCLVPATKDWLGKYGYIMVVSAIVNHSGRSVGSQIDGAVLTTLGTLIGLLWGCLGLYAALAASGTAAGYGFVLAIFLILFSALIGLLRCVFIRFYQAILSAGIAICYTCLADSSDTLIWQKFKQYVIPWTLGQAIALAVCLIVFPAAGTRALVISVQGALQVIQSGLILPRPASMTLNRDLSWRFVDLSEAVRDFTIDLTLSPFNPNDVRAVRNLTQGVIRSVLALRPNTTLFHLTSESLASNQSGTTITMSLYPGHKGTISPNQPRVDPCQLVADALAVPIRDMIDTLGEAVSRIIAVIMDISGYRKYLGPSKQISSDISEISNQLERYIVSFDVAEEALISNANLPPSYTDHPDLVELFLFINPVRQMAGRVQDLLQKLIEMQNSAHSWRIHLPSYPFVKSLSRSNAQVRHDRGGLTAGFYFKNKEQLDKLMKGLQSRAFVPTKTQIPDDPLHSYPLSRASPLAGKEGDETEYADVDEPKTKVAKLRYQLWVIMHRLQRFESRFMVKIALLIALFSIPAWLPQSQMWWDDNESWWTVASIWIMMHPRVGGNLQDLVIRVLSAVVASVWGVLAYTAGDGNPYVMAIFAAIFMIPMLYRATQSGHPRSGVIGSIAFTIVSLSEYNNSGLPSAVIIGWTRGLAFVIGLSAAVIVNLVFWPFIARHELRKSISGMIFYSAIVYRGIVARYIYYSEGDEPSPADVSRSEMMEGRLREGFVRMRQLMELTRHEIKVRAPFNPLPYSALIEACEQFFERLVDVRQSSVYFEPYMLTGHTESNTALLAARRDAVASILMNLYVLGSALRSHHPVPRYLPSAASARRRLLDIMEITEAENANGKQNKKSNRGRRWADVYHYAYSSALTDIVDQLQQLSYYTKEIVGEVGFDIEHEL